MSYNAALIALIDMIRAEWAATPVIVEGEGYERPDPPQPFVLIELDGSNGRPIAIGSRGDVRHVLAAELTAFAPEGQAAVLREMAERLGEMLGYRTIDQHGLRLWAPSFGRLHAAEGDTGWLALTVTLPVWVDAIHG